MKPSPTERRVPFGYNKGKKLGDVPDDELRSLREWMADRNQEGGFDSLMSDVEAVLDERQGLPLDLGDAMHRRQVRGTIHDEPNRSP
jgi:hypothetical protein